MTARRRSATALALATALLGGAMTTTPAAAADPEPVEAGITVPRVEGMGEDWIHGVDVSTVLSLEESGVVFRDFDGQPADLFEVLAESGVNWVRVRVWNEPYSSADPSHGYGGGNVDAERATEIGRRATEAGMQVLVDFHYSDFWAHPGQQLSPRAWRGMDVTERAQALHDYTAETLTMMDQAGVAVGMVQVGNETTGGEIAGVSGWDDTAQLFQAGSAAVRETLGTDVQVAVHFTNPERAGQYASVARELDTRGVDYDVFLSSYYPYWHGSLENLTAVLDEVATTYDKDVAVAETSWAYTLEDGDGFENSVDSAQEKYSVSVQGQALAVRDVMQAVADVSEGHGLGTFYWEPAWLPVGPPEQAEANWDLWQQHGSGWASTYSQEFYDPDGSLGEDWADEYGGSAWDNQALFAFDGTPLESLRVYEYAETGAVGPREVDQVASPSVTVADGEPIELPGQVQVSYTDGTSEDQDVTWSDSVDWILAPGTYTVRGRTAAGLDATATVTVLGEVDSDQNYVVNPGFEDGVEPWTGTGSGYTISSAEDPYAGERSLHFWSEEDYSFAIEQRLTGVPAGQYRLSVQVQGGDAGAADEMQISAASGISTMTADFTLAGYGNWQHPQTPELTVAADGVVTVRAELTLSAGAWGTLDEVQLVPVAASSEVSTDELAALVDRAEGLDRAVYTDSSLAAVDAALVRAQFVLGSPEPGQASVDAAVEELDAALAALVEQPTPTPTAEPTPTPEPTDGAAPTDTPSTAAAGAGADETTSTGEPADDPAGAAELSRTGATLPPARLLVAGGLLAAGAILLLLRRRTTP
ncbi:glycosyl hydrolase 53 family protein [Ruania albidiflava]|uniref:glycosyl hydrolase 53 family protein n=1 Tax=Ruania albidiflava TaxID=366586 RepID=UPI000481B7C7|nr:glycosyl hydrolase 53 family protein [Ruania albidiflava]